MLRYHALSRVFCDTQPGMLKSALLSDLWLQRCRLQDACHAVASYITHDRVLRNPNCAGVLKLVLHIPVVPVSVCLKRFSAAQQPL